MNETSVHERRKSIRVPGREETILRTPNGLFALRDISASGLSFICDNDDFFPDQWPVDIIYAGTPLYLKGIGVRLVRERLDESSTFLTPATKEIGVKFIGLDTRELQLLEALLNLHAPVNC